MTFHVKRVLRDGSFLLILLLLLLIPFFAEKAGHDVKTPPYGFFCGFEGEDASLLEQELIRSGFTAYSSEAELRAAVRDRTADCGIVFPDNFDILLRTGRTDGAVSLILSPESLFPELARIQTVSVITYLYAPYVSAEEIRSAAGEICPSAAVPEPESIRNAYYEMTGAGSVFRLEILSADGFYQAEQIRSHNLFKGTAGILILLSLWIGCCRPCAFHARLMAGRLGRKKAFLHILLPETAVRFLMILMTAAACCMVSEETSMILPVILYSLITVMSGTVLAAFLPDAVLLVLTVFLMILTLGICPVFADLAPSIPAISTLRYGLLPYLLWIL